MNLKLESKWFDNLTEYDFAYPTRTIILKLGSEDIESILNVIQTCSNKDAMLSIIMNNLMNSNDSLMGLFNHKYKEFFSFDSEELSMKLYTENYNQFIFERNNQKVVLSYDEDLSQGVNLPFFIYIGWTPETLFISLLDNVGKIIVDNYGLVNTELYEKHAVVKRLNTKRFKPITLLNSILRNSSYNPIVTEIEFNKKVVSFFHQISLIIEKNRNADFAWDQNIKPKLETQIQPTIENMIYADCAKYNLILNRETASANGSVDFLISSIINSQIYNICIEVKKAHASSIDYGLLTQLPLYMESKSSKYGVYCILWFKGEDFNEPQKYNTPEELKDYLEMKKIESSLDNIDIVVLDLSKRIAPSKMKK